VTRERLSPVVALCGVDGAGKTTLFRALQERGELPGVSFVGRGPDPAERFVTESFPREHGDERDWFESEFGNAVAIACALDFADHYHQRVLPLREESSLVVSDRYASCYIAYARAQRPVSTIAVSVLAGVPPPECILFLTAEWDVIRRRLANRPARPARPGDEFELPSCQERFLEGYRRLFVDYPSRVVEIENGGTVDEALSRVVGILKEIRVSTEAGGC
jgi:thymidylate kinase